MFLILQIACGVAQPFLMAVLACSALSRLQISYALPPISDPRALLETYAKLSRPFRPTLLVMLAANTLAAVMVTHAQGRTAEKLHRSLTEQKRVFISWADYRPWFSDVESTCWTVGHWLARVANRLPRDSHIRNARHNEFGLSHFGPGHDM